ncbi:carbohydrate ABC transporter permease [Fusobacterium sp.]|uniref:carbohydrate ABC transporter permease n=1 Tax=Fusobacterium sp. TaxID=68766 RepID=UPI001DAAE02C|nr:carbohydrate ABC transporter permease [Fusobacterium sp.]MBS5789006.1 carbohydrate ABC transporter permease [Fusobacterium sp.]MDY3060592.1 carbohydrate ABC transporter permease [Fusobacterium sp.]MEE1475875.1 carbohydrate ABC transporter permease [Fusobacterium sp.]
MENKTKNYIFNIFNHGIFIIVTLIVLLPLLLVVLSSFKTPEQIAMGNHLSLPAPFTLENYTEVFVKGNILTGLKNSVLLVIGTVVVNVLLSSMVAYSLSRFEFTLKKVYFLLFSLAMLVPSFIAEITRFGIIGKIGLYDTLFAPMIIYISTDILQIYVYKQFIDQIPYSLDESARIDGCSYFTIYWKIIFPLILPATATLIILKSVDILNDMYTPYLYMPSAENATLTTMLMNYVGRSGSWAKLSAAIVLVMLPTIIMYLIFKKKILSGIVAGAVKE